MLRLELAQFAHERVEFRVGDFRFVGDEVALVVILDELTELRETRDYFLRRFGVGALGHAENLCADRELRCGCLIVDPVADLAREQHRALGLAGAVARETARRSHQRLPPQLYRIATSPGQLTPRVEERLPQRLRLFAYGPVRRYRTPRDPSAAVKKPRERSGVVEVERADVEVNDLRA